jgi:deleted-in-malignant-brain-tumors protein 1
VCAANWDNRDAEVVCRQLGFNGTSYSLHEYDDNLNQESTVILSCMGNETRLFDCLYLEDGIPYCEENKAKSVVMCSDTSCEKDAVRLVGGHTVKEGRVQVCYDGEWHSVCGDRWSDVGAEVDVVCSVLGYSSELSQKITSYCSQNNLFFLCSFNQS